MKTSFRKSFARDLKKIKDQVVLDRVNQVIDEVGSANAPEHIAHLKKN